MSRKGFLFAAVAVLFASSAFTSANAGSVPASFAPQNDNAAVVNIGYNSHGYYDHQYGPYYGNGLLDFPATLIGGALGIVTGALDGVFYGSPFFADPYYDNGYYRYHDHNDQYYNNAYYGSGYDGYRYYGNRYYGSGYYGSGYNGKGYGNGYYADPIYTDRYHSGGYYNSGQYNSGYYGYDYDDDR